MESVTVICADSLPLVVAYCMHTTTLGLQEPTSNHAGARRCCTNALLPRSPEALYSCPRLIRSQDATIRNCLCPVSTLEVTLITKSVCSSSVGWLAVVMVMVMVMTHRALQDLYL